MRKFVVPALLLCALVSFANNLTGLKSQRNSNGSDLKRTRRKILQQELPKLTSSALALKNPELKIETLARLADLLWDHDAQSAQELFENTYALLRSIEPADDRA